MNIELLVIGISPVLVTILQSSDTGDAMLGVIPIRLRGPNPKRDAAVGRVSIGRFGILATSTSAEGLLDGFPEAEAKEKGMGMAGHRTA